MADDELSLDKGEHRKLVLRSLPLPEKNGCQFLLEAPETKAVAWALKLQQHEIIRPVPSFGAGWLRPASGKDGMMVILSQVDRNLVFYIYKIPEAALSKTLTQTQLDSNTIEEQPPWIRWMVRQETFEPPVIVDSIRVLGDGNEVQVKCSYKRVLKGEKYANRPHYFRIDLDKEMMEPSDQTQWGRVERAKEDDSTD